MYFEKFEKIKWSQNLDLSTQKLIYLHLNFFNQKVPILVTNFVTKKGTYGHF